METIQILSSIILGLVIFYLGILEKRLSSMQGKLDMKVSHKEMNKVIELEIKTVHNEQSNLKEDLMRIEDKLDAIISKITKIR